MYHTTGFSKVEIIRLCTMLHEAFPTPVSTVGRKPSLGLYKKVVVTLAYLRRNRVQQELAELFETSQSTISRAISQMTPMLDEVLHHWVPTAEDLDPDIQLIVDGTLLPCWSWRNEPDLWSGKHRTTGQSVLVATTLTGDLAWVSDPMPGKTHDAKALRESRLLDSDTDAPAIGDKGFIGLGMLTPFRRPPGGELLDWQKEFNATVNSIRAVVERAIANLKTWRILHTDYRRPIKTFRQTISTVIALEFYRLTF